MNMYLDLAHTARHMLGLSFVWKYCLYYLSISFTIVYYVEFNVYAIYYVT